MAGQPSRLTPAARVAVLARRGGPLRPGEISPDLRRRGVGGVVQKTAKGRLLLAAHILQPCAGNVAAWYRFSRLPPALRPASRTH
jgi:hypothetical protein